MIDYGKHNVLGVRIDALDYEAAVARIAQAARDRRPLGVSALAVHGVMTGVGDKEHRYRLNQLELVLPDGQPVRWALRWLHGVRLPDRVYGPNLMLKTCQRAAEDGLPIFLFGGTAEMIEKLVKNLTDRFPPLQIAGTQPSQFRQFAPKERQAAVDTIRNSGAALTFVGLGCPRQEVWAYEFREALSMPVLAVGAAFAFHAGLLSQAPEFMQRRGLEWAYRLFKEPLRLWKRYLFLNPLYLWLILLQRTKLRGFDPGNTTRPVKELMYG